MGWVDINDTVRFEPFLVKSALQIRGKPGRQHRPPTTRALIGYRAMDPQFSDPLYRGFRRELGST
jgi:hypothetical protein